MREEVLTEERSMERPSMKPERHVVLLDGDRCLWRTERFMEIIYERLEYHGIPREQMADLKAKTEAEGGSFDTLTALRAHYEDEIVNRVIDEVSEEALSRHDLPYDDERCLLTPGARELMESIPQADRIIVTRGGEEMQLLKLQTITRIDTSRDLYEITDRDDKGRMVFESYVPDEDRFVLRWVRNANGDIVATHVTLVEDKAKAFRGFQYLGDKVKGFLLRVPGEPTLPSQGLLEGEKLPPNVEVVESLYAVRDAVSALGGTALGSDFARN